MRIAQVAPLFESVPPTRYGGTERIVYYLTEELIRQGHDVTLFASADSLTSARLRPGCDKALRLCREPHDAHAMTMLMVENVYRRENEFDLVHFHIDYYHFGISRHHQLPRLTTLHGRLDLPHLKGVYAEYHDEPVVSISNSQRRYLPNAKWTGTVYNGIPADQCRLHERPGDYLAFIGRISPEKGCRQAIEIALRSGMPIKIAAKVDEVDKEYFEAQVKPLLGADGVEYVGEISDGEKDNFLGNAYALLFPIAWPEPFGLVMIEAMSCGTPVVAFPYGSVPEIVEHGKTGFLVESAEEAVQALARIPDIDRRTCRRVFEQRFTAERMVRAYENLYQNLYQQRSDASALKSRYVKGYFHAARCD